MVEFISSNSKKLKWLMEQLSGPIFCGDHGYKQEVLKSCPTDQFCIGFGRDWVAEFCLYDGKNMDQMSELKRADLQRFAARPKPNRVRIRQRGGPPYRVNYYSPRYNRRVPVVAAEVMTANPYTAVQLLGEIGGAKCGPYVTPTLLQNCPQHQFCQLPGGHEMCVYGPWQANEMNLRF